MTIPIYLDKSLSVENPNASLKKQTTTVTKINPVSETKNIQQNTTSLENTSIQISSEAKILNSYLNKTENELIDWNKVNQIKDQINAGTYTVNHQKIAEKIINLEGKVD